MRHQDYASKYCSNYTLRCKQPSKAGPLARRYCCQLWSQAVKQAANCAADSPIRPVNVADGQSKLALLQPLGQHAGADAVVLY
jgi:hypothetical protein